MSTADSLIAGLVGAAEFDSEGAFSLDRDKAREKMRQFQLANPHRYVLLLVEAAVLRGATSVVFDIDSDDMYMRFDAALSWTDLDELYAALFVDRSSVEIRSRRELALAFNAVMALNPRWVRIESVGLDAAGQPQAVAASLRSDDADDIRKLDSVPDGPGGMQPPWTRVHVKERFRPGLLVRFLNDIGGSIPEEQLIRARCRYASASLVLDEQRVSEGLPTNLIGGVRFEHEHMRGVAGLALEPDRKDRSAVVLLSNGVEITTHELGGSVDGLWYWVDSSRFRKDVSQGDIVRSDPAYQDMLMAIAGARDRVLGNLAQLWADGQFGEGQPLTAADMFELLRKCFLQWADANWLRPDAGPLGQLAKLPLWRTVDQRWISPLELVEQADKLRGVMYTERDFDGVMPRNWGPVIHVIDGTLELEAIARVYPDAQLATTRLEREVPWELARRRWRSRPHAIELPRAAGMFPLAFEQGEYKGQVALRPGRISDVRVIVDGCLLCEPQLELGAIGISAVITGPLAPAADHQKPRTDRQYATLVLLLANMLPRLLAAWAEAGDSPDMLAHNLGVVLEPDFAVRFMVAFGFAEQAARELLARLGEPSLLPPMGLGEGEVPTAIAKLVTVPTADLRRVSLAALDADRRARARLPGKVLFVDSLVKSSVALTELLVHADPACKRLLVAVFGAAAVHDDTALYLSELGRRNFEARPQRYPAPPLMTWTAPVELQLDHHEIGGKVSGYVGIDASRVRDWQPDRERRVTIEVFTRERSLCVVEERSWLPGAEAQLSWDAAPVNHEWTGLAGSLAPLRRAVEHGLLALLRARAEASIEFRPNDDARRLLWLAIVAPFVTAEHFRCWRVLRAAAQAGGDPQAAVASYHAVVELFPGVPLAELREAITLLCDDGKLPTRDNLLALMDRSVVPPAGGREFHRGLLELFPLFERVPMVELTSGQAVSLATLVELYDANDELAYVEDRSLSFSDDEYMIVRSDDIDQVALLRLFGRDALKEVSAWIHERRSQQRFEARAQLDELRVPVAQRMIGVEFQREGFTGELAIPDWTAGDGGSMRVTYCHERRVVEDIELHALLPVIGIVDDPEAPLSGDFSSVETNSPRIAALRRVLDSVLGDQLLPALADRWAELDDRQRSVAWTWIAVLWRRQSPRGGQHPERLSSAGRRLAALDLFVDTDDTPRSLDDLIERYAEHRCLWYVERKPVHDVPPPFPILLLRSGQRVGVAALFPNFADFSERWAARVAGHQRKTAAAELPPLTAEPNCLIQVELDRHGMRGVLWLPDRHPFQDGVVAGSAGKFVEVIMPVEQLPVIGVIDGFEADDGFQHVERSGPQQRYLEARTIAAYSGLVAELQAELERPDKTDFLDTKLAQRRALRNDMLRAATIALCRASLAGARFDAILGNLHQRLQKLPLLRLISGKLISADLAAKARPTELAHLGIWDVNAPGLDISERARLLLGGDAPPEPKPEPKPEPESKPSADLATSLTAALAGLPAGIDGAADDDAVGLAMLSSLMGIAAADEAPPPEPKPEPEPEPIIELPPAPDPVDVLLERIRDELRLLRERHEITLADGLLDAVQAEPGRGRELISIDNRVVFDSTHPRFARALQDDDPVWVSFLASVAYTALNRWLDEVTDDDEQAFHGAHAALLLTAMLE